ncbi:MAG: hypothetical protein Fur0019_15280 [Tibeticola sp.]
MRHDYPEEGFIADGGLYDAAFDPWLESGPYAGRATHEAHGPLKTEASCLVLEISLPNRKRMT